MFESRAEVRRGGCVDVPLSDGDVGVEAPLSADASRSVDAFLGSERSGSAVEGRAVEGRAGAPLDVVFRELVRALATGVGHPAVTARGRSVPRGVALAELLDEHLPGVELVKTLIALDPAELHDAALVEVVAAWERVGSWVAGRQSAAVAELAHRRSAATGRVEFVVDEVGARLGVTRAAAEAKVVLALHLEEMPELRAGLATGALDVRKATVLSEGFPGTHVSDARAAHRVLLPDAPGLTVPQLRARIRQLELAADPEAATKRHQRATSDRFVRLTPAPDAMAWLTAYLPADDAMCVYTALDAVAGCASPQDARGIDARRADVLTGVLGHVLDTGVVPAGVGGDVGTPLRTRHGRRPHLQVTAAATTLLGLDETPAELAGYGPVPAAMARRIATDATWRRIFTDPATGQLTGIGPRRYRAGADLTSTVLARDVTCTFPGCRVAAARCDLDHIRPFDHVSAARSDERASAGTEQTTTQNLHALCRHHHRLKTHAGWSVTRDDATGRTLWTAPTGHTHIREPVPIEPARLVTDQARLVAVPARLVTDQARLVADPARLVTDQARHVLAGDTVVPSHAMPLGGAVPERPGAPPRESPHGPPPDADPPRSDALGARFDRDGPPPF
ncbi:HNH endonuclease signature motif containing protein [Cellulomonas fimi]|uniref:DUF222 domain-containing protein n=1 Tax=Cellulomonas fimi TaxID=1708 RepID=A0A7Y0QFJ1_CELFI|nr:HNH endonuclease signature motif containing protein [Cellulomonas fimi]NMR19096.1 DUF222 domain-containing protein [Cellulomonas fimi]